VGVVRWTETREEAVAELESLLEPGDVLLVKGSRAMGLEAVGEALAGVRV
jgi:UDP-N-acetylmuramyl pentapeptide synthase